MCVCVRVSLYEPFSLSMDTNSDCVALSCRAATPSRANRFAKLEVHKDGQRVDQVALGERACTVLGRREDICDYEMPHPSISRQHVALVHDKQGCINVLDLGSAQGSFVNGKEIEAETPVGLKGAALERALCTERAAYYRDANCCMLMCVCACY